MCAGRHADGHRGCPVIGEDQKSSVEDQNDAIEPKRTQDRSDNAVDIDHLGRYVAFVHFLKKEIADKAESAQTTVNVPNVSTLPLSKLWTGYSAHLWLPQYPVGILAILPTRESAWRISGKRRFLHVYRVCEP
jgi:hypothetical protein